MITSEYQKNQESSEFLSQVETFCFTMTNNYLQSMITIVINEEILLVRIFVIDKFLN